MSDESSTGRSDPASQASGPDPDTAVDEPDLEDAASAGEEPAGNNNDDVEESPRDEDEEDDDGNLVDGEGGAEEHDAQSSAGSPRPDSAAQANEPSSEPAIAAAGLAPQTVGEPSPTAATAAPVSSIGNMTEQEVYAMALNEFKTKGEPEAGPAPPRRRLQVPRLDELCIAKIAANLSEWPLLDQVPQQYVSSIVRRVAPATIQLSRAAQQICRSARLAPGDLAVTNPFGAQRRKSSGGTCRPGGRWPRSPITGQATNGCSSKTSCRSAWSSTMHRSQRRRCRT